MAELLQFVSSGLTVGAVYALVGLGFTLIFNASDIINFAQGEFVMLGGMTTVFLAAAGLPLPKATISPATAAGTATTAAGTSQARRERTGDRSGRPAGVAAGSGWAFAAGVRTPCTNSVMTVAR